MEGHRLAQTAAYGDLGSENPAPIMDAYERQAEPAIELQLSAAAKKGSIMAVEGGAGVGVTLRTLVTRRSAIEAHGGVLGWLLTGLGAVGAIRLTFDLEDDGTLYQAIE